MVILTLPRGLIKILNRLKFHIMLKALDESSKNWIENIYTDLHNKNNEVFISFEDLKYAYTSYLLKVRLKSKTSEDTDAMWSEFREHRFRTNAKIPETTPNVCRNCFNVMDNGNIFVYWMDVSEFYKNGKNFEYELRIKNKHGIEVNRQRQHKASIMISNSLNSSFIIDLYSVNHVGISPNHSTIHITKDTESLVKIKKELFNDFGYKLSWKLRDTYDVESFTILWCRQRFELPNQCDSSISFVTLPPDQTEFFMNTSHSIQFGVAVNRANVLNSGFEWAECTASKPDGNCLRVLFYLRIHNLNLLYRNWSNSFCLG